MPQEFVKATTKDQLAPGDMLCVEVGGQRILIANVDGEYYATDDTCTHEDASLATGALQGEWVKCPLHGSRFNVRTGEVQEEPADEPLKCYPVRVEGNAILVGI